MDRTDEALVSAFSEALRSKRLAAGLTQEQLAERADVSTRFISFLETRRRQPTLTVIAALSNGLGLTLAEFAGEIERAWLVAKDNAAKERS